MKGLSLSGNFFFVCAIIIVLMILAYPFPVFMPIAFTGLSLFGMVIIIDMLQVYARSVKLFVDRETTTTLLSLGDDNPIRIIITNNATLKLWLEIVDELPEQLQHRKFLLTLILDPQEKQQLTYYIRPLTRGEYHFGKIHIFISTRLGLVKRRISYPLELNIPVYPSLIQMKKYELRTLARLAAEYGVKKVRRIGHSYEFEQIKHYVQGDDFRSINWKATGRRSQLMVNQYEDEKSQHVYCIIDKSRVMHMPFHGLSLFDYAVNASLVISNIVLGKQDKIGLVTFAEKPKTLIKADRNKQQLKRILDGLYREREGETEAHYESLYLVLQKFVTSRSLLFLYTNFESTYALQRALPQLRRLNRKHLLVVVFFENNEITTSTSTHVETLEDIYLQATAEHFVLTKIQLAQQLRQSGIITILTKPENLTIDSINKYLELKSKGAI